MNIADVLSARKLFPEKFGAGNICSSRLSNCNSLYRKTLFGHHGCVNTLTFSPDERLLASSGDDRRVLVWDTAKCVNERQPSYHMQMCSKHDSNVFTTCFNSDASLLMSGGNDERILSHDVHSNKLLADFTFSGTEILFIDCHPTNPNVSIAGASCGKLMSVDQRVPPQSDVNGQQQPHRTAVIRDDCVYSSFRCVKFVPCDGNYIVAANSISGLSLRDLRKSKDQVVIHYTQTKQHQQDSLASLTTDNGDMMHCTLDSSGTQLLALSGRQSTLYLYDIDKPEEPKATFASRCLFKSTTTIKVCSFFGPSDNYVVCGSNDFNIYMWKVPKQGGFKHVRIPHMQLKGHRSIVNQVVGSKRYNLLASSGTEKIIKIWSPFHINHGMGSIDKEVGVTREHRYSYDDYLNFILTEGPIDHDYEFGTTEEDPRVLALFDLDHLRVGERDGDLSSGSEDADSNLVEPSDGFRRFSRYSYDDGEQVLPNQESTNFSEGYLDALERSSQESGEGTPSRKTRRGGRSRDNSAKDSRDDDSESSEDLYTFDWPEDSNSSTNESKRKNSAADSDDSPNTIQPKSNKSKHSTEDDNGVNGNATKESSSNLDDTVSVSETDDEGSHHNSSAVRLKNADRGRRNRKRKSSQMTSECGKESKDG